MANTIFITKGTITNKNNEPIKGLTVKAFHQTDKDLLIIGNPAVTNGNGEYAIKTELAKGPFFRKNEKSANVLIKVFSNKGKHLFTSKVHKNQKKEVTINAEIDLVEKDTIKKKQTLYGCIKLPNGKLAQNFSVQAFHKILRKEELIGEGLTDKKGKYAIDILTDEKQSKDGIFIKIFSPTGNSVGVSDIHFNAGKKIKINHKIDKDKYVPLSEFMTIQLAITPIIADQKIIDLEESEGDRDITYLSKKSGIEYDTLTNFIQAHHFENESKIDAAFWFGIGANKFNKNSFKSLSEHRNNIKERLRSTQQRSIKKLLRIGIKDNVIDDPEIEIKESWLENYADYVASLEINEASELNNFIKPVLEEVGIKEQKKQVRFAKLFNKHQTFDEALIKDLKKDKNFKVAEIKNFKASYDLSELTNGDVALIKSIKKKYKIQEPKQVKLLAKNSEKDWIAIAKSNSKNNSLNLPSDLQFPKNTETTIAQIQGKHLHQTFINAFPTIAFSGDLERAIKSKSTEGLKNPTKIKKIIDNNPDFDFLNSSIDELAKKDNTLEKDKNLQLELKAVQRVFKLSPNFESSNALLADNLHSAQSIYRLGESAFINKYGNKPGFNRASARSTWRKAEATHAISVNLLAELQSFENAGSIAALNTGNAVSDFPNWNNLFKGGDVCECKHCRSVYSPAAYFADILMFLKERRSNGIAGTPVKDLLFDRRPDLGYLELNCENANVTLPYIDVVNEILENVVADGENDIEITGLTNIDGTDIPQAKDDIVSALESQDIKIGENTHLAQVGVSDNWVMHSDTISYLLKKKATANYFIEIIRNTKAGSEELRANPQYVNPFAYQKLKETTLPFELPFDLFSEEVKAACNTVKIKRWDLMQKFKGNNAPNNPKPAEVAAVYFGISVDPQITNDEKTIILKSKPSSQFKFWGFNSNAGLLSAIKNVKTFLKITKISYNDLLILLDLKFINPQGSLQIKHLDSTCDLDKKEITSLDTNALDRINRFLRLWRKLDWKFWELDLVINQHRIGKQNSTDATGNLNEPFLVNLMYFVELKNLLGKKVDIEEVCSLFGNLNTKTKFTELHEKRENAIYQELFLNSKLINPLDEAFELNLVDSATSTEKIVDHKSVVQAALRLSETDLDFYLNLTRASDDTLYIDNGVDGDLILSNLSFLHRHSFLAKILKIKAEDWKILLKIFNADIGTFANPKSTLEFVENIKNIQSSDFKIDDLNYILSADKLAKAALTESEISRLLTTLRNSIKTVNEEFDPNQYEFLQAVPLSDTENLTELATSLLQKLNKNDQTINRILTVLDNTVTTESKAEGIVALGFNDFPEAIKNSIKISFNQNTEIIRFTGTMTDAELNTLLNDPSLALITGNVEYQNAINELYNQPRLDIKFYEPIFIAPLDDLPDSIDFKQQLSAELSLKISYDSIERQIEFIGFMTNEEKIELDNLSSDSEYLNTINALHTQPITGIFPSNEIWLNTIDLDFDAIDFHLTHLALAINKLLDYFKEKEVTNAIISQLSDQFGIAQNMTDTIVNHYPIIGIETIFEHIINTFSTTSSVVDYASFKETFDAMYWLHRISLFIDKWGLSFDALNWLIDFNGSTNTIDFSSLPLDDTMPISSIENFLRTEKLLILNNQYSNEDISLLDIIDNLVNSEYATVTDFSLDVELLTEWDPVQVEDWVNNIDLIFEQDYLFAENWIRLVDSMKILDQINAGTITTMNYANATMSEADAQTIKQLLRSKYGTETWLKISTEIQDVLREQKRDALATYILAQGKPADAPSGKWENTNDLYAYYLLDIEMNSCMLTSRLVQASGSVQLFVQRCFMGLEPTIVVKADGDDGDSAWRWWKWMRKYRVWEANRKIFLYPENWILPELRLDKSPIFQDLENELLQNEINQLNVEKAYLNYLDKLNEVARLDVAAFYHEDDADLTIMHVFGRTANADPHIYYYRQYDYRVWTPWKQVEVDIQGDQLIPFVVNKRLYIFWPEYREEPDEDLNSTAEVDVVDDGESEVPPTWKRTQLRLAGSEFRNNKWTPKKVSKDYYESHAYTGTFDTTDIRFFPVDKSDLNGQVGIKFEGNMDGAFELFGCDGIPVISNISGSFNHITKPSESDLINLDYKEKSPRGDNENDLSLTELEYFLGYSDSWLEILNRTPNRFLTYFAWNISYLDKLLNGLNILFGGQFDIKNDLPAGSWLPFFYADRRRTFVAFPMLYIRQVQSDEDGTTTPFTSKSTYYYPDIKAETTKFAQGIEDAVRAQFENADLSILTQAQKDQWGDFFMDRLDQTVPTPISDDDLIELFIKFIIEIFKGYIGLFSLNAFKKRKYHFTNFYHPFICDFLKLVYNPNQGIPALMSRETQLKETNFSFKYVYQPTSKVYDFNIGNNYPKEIVDFSPRGSYSPYNWELFYHTPLMIANSLSKNQRFEEAMDWYHYIFNPIGVEGTLPNGSNATAPQKYWITKPFFLTTNNDYQQQRIDTILKLIAGDSTAGNLTTDLMDELSAQVKDWRDYPFEPHRIAQYRTVAYQKTVFMNYLDNLIAWGDYLFRQDSMESINEATQLYILAAELLGPKPQTVPPQVNPPIETFNELENDFDDFSNALIQVENYIPAINTVGDFDDTLVAPNTSAPIPTLYFCIPQNDKILAYWDTIADRLFKIRNCMNIEGIVRQLSLFEPEIDPGALVKAVAGGLDISSALSDLNAPLPYYRFSVLIQKANEVCSDVKNLGNALLMVLEKKDAEELALLRQVHEISSLESIIDVIDERIIEATAQWNALKETKKLSEIKRDYYNSRKFMNAGEIVATVFNGVSIGLNIAASVTSLLAATTYAIPNIQVGGAGIGGSPVATAETGGLNIGGGVRAATGFMQNLATVMDKSAAMSSTIGSYYRRKDEWDFQHDLAEKEIEQIEKQIAAAESRVKTIYVELENQKKLIDNSKEMDDFMTSKYTNKDLYQWMIGQISQVYFQSYQLAYDLAKRAERCYRFELGIQDSNFIKFGYWDSLKKGLLSGDKLQYDLRKLETSYREHNKRELELSKHISLATLDPFSLIQLKETGKCFFNLPEEIFDLDYPGHYFRRIKSVSISLPCIAGPYTTISCSLRLLNNHIRIQTGLADGYPHNNDEGVWVNDSRFVQNNIPIKAIATSNAQNDAGVFQLDFRDERYLPFERAGVISEWTIDLFNDDDDPGFGKALRQFDYNSISDVIVHINYTAREAGGLLKKGAIENLHEYFSNEELTPSVKVINLKHDFPTDWHKMVFPDDEGNGNTMSLKLTENLFSYKDHLHTLKVNSIILLARCSEAGDYTVQLNPPLPDPPPADADTMILSTMVELANMHFAQKDTTANAIELDFSEENIWTLTIESPTGNNLTENEIEDMFLLVGFVWDD